jgi:hypothetical protein
VAPTSLAGQFEQPYRPMGPPTFNDPGAALREDYGLTQRAISDGLGRAARMGREEPARHRGDCALIVVATERARAFPQNSVYLHRACNRL